jgi:hypothetical protein
MKKHQIVCRIIIEKAKRVFDWFIALYNEFQSPKKVGNVFPKSMPPIYKNLLNRIRSVHKSANLKSNVNYLEQEERAL